MRFHFVAMALIGLLGHVATGADSQPPRRDYSIPLVDLAGETQRQVIVDREPGQYLGHPTTVLLEDGRTMLIVYPKGHGRGAIVYLRPEGSALDAGLEHALQRIRQPEKKDADAPDLTSPAAAPPSSRELGIGSQIIRQLGLSKLRLMTNHTTDWPGIEAFGLQIVERVPLKL